jgi:REP element-mobilizing transposase RayT
MARPLRIEYSGALYHVTSRGNAKQAIFKDEEDRRLFLDALAAVVRRCNWLCHAYVLMTNHYHVIIETPDGNLSPGMRQLNGVYTQAVNRRHRRVGHLFQGRYKAILIQKDSHLLEVCRYVVLNPVKAKLVQSPNEWQWSSYRATAGIEKPHACLTTAWILSQFGVRAGVAYGKYKKFVREGMERASIWKQVTGQVLLGEDGFTERFRNYLRKHKDIKEIPRSQRFLHRPGLEKLFSNSTNNHTRNRKIQEAIERYGYSQKAIADHLGMHYASISRILKTENMLKYKT